VRRIRRFLLAMLAGTILAGVLLTILIAESGLHVRTPRPSPQIADAVARENAAAWEEVQVQASDGTPLRAWFFTPAKPNGSAVLLLHGVADTRAGMRGHAGFLLRSGYAVLAADSRGHGGSGGDLLTYGVREAADIRTWSDWLFDNRRATHLYGLGASMGAAILLQSLATEPRFQAVVAECPFATFEEVAGDRLAQVSRMPRPIFVPVVWSGFVYARMRYGIDLRRASPADAVRHTHIPVLLIHGTRDENIPMRHSEELHALNPRDTTLWLVPGAGHVASLSADPEKYSHVVTDWFAAHRN
jgi:alpha-beta hydrolase superfamily lysophospholipase